ncbi:YcjF family protein [Deinococcus sp.]|uniref:YcjF family protein n=1 Tax=Deinococcus sp. TaxID=47478 RepID=UPI003C797469
MLPLLKQVLDNFNLDVDPALTPSQNAEEVIRSAALLAGAIAVEPLPFADLLLITPLQAKMVLHIGKVYGFEVTATRAREMVQELGATVAYGFAVRQVMRGIAKLALPVIGGLITAPAVYGWTYALGRTAEVYFQRKQGGQPFGKPQQIEVAQEARKSSRNILPSARDFSELARELRRRADEKANPDAKAGSEPKAAELKDGGTLSGPDRPLN